MLHNPGTDLQITQKDLFNRAIEHFGKQGLRCILFAHVDMATAEFNALNNDFNKIE